MTDTVFATPAAQVERDHWGRPRILKPDGSGKTVPYTRATTLAGTLDDLYGLMSWKQRQTAIGLAARDDLLLAVKAADPDDKKHLNSICEQAMEAAESSAAATTGTALHSLSERLDLGVALPTVPEEHAKALQAYIAATDHLEVVEYDGHPAVEQFLVCDEIQAAGTADRIVRVPDMDQPVIADLKTGRIDYGALKIAMQLAIYAHGQRYDIATGERTPIDVDLRNALIIHLPAGARSCRLWWVDIGAGWEAVQHALIVRDWRKRKNLTSPAGDEVLVD